MRVRSTSLVGFALGILAIVVGSQQSDSYRSLSLGEALGVKGGETCTSGCCHLDPVQSCPGGTDIFCESNACSGGGGGTTPYCSPELPSAVEFHNGSWQSCNDNYSQGKDCGSIGMVVCETYYDCPHHCVEFIGLWICETDLSSGEDASGFEFDVLEGETQYCV